MNATTSPAFLPPVYIVPKVAGLDVVRPAQLRRLSQMERPQQPPADSQPSVGPHPCLPQQSWLWPRRIATGKVTVLVGENGLGKSSVAADLAARVSEGSEWPDNKVGSAPHGMTLVISPAEEQCGLLTARLEGAGADLDHVCAMPLEPLDEVAIGSPALRPRSIVERLALVQSALEALPACKLVVIDSLSQFLDGPDGRRSGAAAIVMLGLAKLARKFGVAIVVVAHLNGTASLRSFSQFVAMLGPSSIGRNVWGVLRDPEDADRQLMVSLDGNFGKVHEALSFRLAVGDIGKCVVEGATGKRSLPVRAESDSPMEDRLAGQHWQTGFANDFGLASDTHVEWETAEPTSLRQVLSAYSGLRISERKYRDMENYVTSRLRDLLAAGAVDRSEIFRDIEASKEQVYRGARGLGIVMQKTGYSGNWVWMLPEYFDQWQAQQEQKRQILRGDREERKNVKRKEMRAERRREREAATVGDASRASPAVPNDLAFQVRSENNAQEVSVQEASALSAAASESSRDVAFEVPLKARGQGSGAVDSAAAEVSSELAVPVPLGSRDLPHDILAGVSASADRAPILNLDLSRPATAEEESWSRSLAEKLRARAAELAAAYQLSLKGEISEEDEERYCWVGDSGEEDFDEERGGGVRDGPG